MCVCGRGWAKSLTLAPAYFLRAGQSSTGDSVVLEEEFDPNYDPTQEEVNKFIGGSCLFDCSFIAPKPWYSSDYRVRSIFGYGLG